jgi:hypothetical protein
MNEDIRKQINNLKLQSETASISSDVEGANELKKEIVELEQRLNDLDEVETENAQQETILTPIESNEYANFMLHKETGRTISSHEVNPILAELNKLNKTESTTSANFKTNLDSVIQQYLNYIGEDVTLYRKYIGFYFSKSKKNITEFLEHKENREASEQLAETPKEKVESDKTPEDYISNMRESLNMNKD